MITSKFVIAFALGLSSSVTIAASATTPSNGCDLVTFKATQVRPYIVDVRQGHHVDRKLIGANVFVPAQQVLTAEYLQSRVESHIAAMKHNAMPNCPLAVAGATVTVSSAGNGYWVQISSTDQNSAEEILRRANELVR